MKKAAAMLVAIFLTVTAVSGMILYFYLDSFSQNDGQNGKDTADTKETKFGEPFNILVMGVDIGVAGSKSSPKRSDTMVILHYDPETSEAAVVSIPRDTKVIIKGRDEKINAAHAYGGTDLAIKTVEDLLDININYYVEINYEGFRKLIDSIGGVDVVIPYDMNYDDNVQNLHIHFKKGQKVHLDGKKAEEFVRWRKNNDGTGYADGDLGRIRTQQGFMVKVVEKLKSPAIIPNILSFARALPQFIDTNLDAMAIINLSKDIPKISMDSIQKYTLKGDAKSIDDISYFIYDPEKNMDTVALLGGKAYNTNRKVDNKNIRIQIMNGSGLNEAGSKIKQKLEDMGYTVTGAGTISGVGFESSYIIDKTLKGSNARQVASDLDIQNVEKDQDTLTSYDMIVILGADVSRMLN